MLFQIYERTVIAVLSNYANVKSKKLIVKPQNLWICKYDSIYFGYTLLWTHEHDHTKHLTLILTMFAWPWQASTVTMSQIMLVPSHHNSDLKEDQRSPPPAAEECKDRKKTSCEKRRTFRTCRVNSKHSREGTEGKTHFGVEGTTVSWGSSLHQINRKMQN